MVPGAVPVFEMEKMRVHCLHTGQAFGLDLEMPFLKDFFACARPPLAEKVLSKMNVLGLTVCVG